MNNGGNRKVDSLQALLQLLEVHPKMDRGLQSTTLPHQISSP